MATVKQRQTKRSQNLNDPFKTMPPKIYLPSASPELLNVLPFCTRDMSYEPKFQYMALEELFTKCYLKISHFIYS